MLRTELPPSCMMIPTSPVLRETWMSASGQSKRSGWSAHVEAPAFFISSQQYSYLFMSSSWSRMFNVPPVDFAGNLASDGDILALSEK
jgi:hypothetical protein